MMKIILALDENNISFIWKYNEYYQLDTLIKVKKAA